MAPLPAGLQALGSAGSARGCGVKATAAVFPSACFSSAGLVPASGALSGAIVDSFHERRRPIYDARVPARA